MSTLKPSKNIEGLLRAWALVSEHHNLQLVIAGKKGWLFENIFNLVKELNLEESVVFTDFVPEEDKPALIKGAKAFILPSFWEGFGLDVVGAMACGVPVIISDRGSLPEVAGNASTIVNPDSPESIAEGIEKILDLSPSDLARLTQIGLKRASEFSWRKTALETIDVLQSVVKK